ncbi:hypothetical protein [Chromohalobacter israelensis]|uniref:hypothetical protein n=1 Tax=Chromohalobacter israelensis TaxID=141390 RepID=UPI00265B73C2|nr:hypothetical protein [Chromohalobacter salexigens]MDO0944656.1 hypothetical protein [Chromohalobacter salexigens]
MSTKRKPHQASTPRSTNTSGPSTPAPRTSIHVRAKTRHPGQRRGCCGVILTGEWKHLVVDDKGSAYKALIADQDVIVERLPETPDSPSEDAGDAES